MDVISSELLVIESWLRWFGHVERKDDNDWVKRCITWEVEGIAQFAITINSNVCPHIGIFNSEARY